MLQRNFIQGTINQDADERMLPQGYLRDALNIRVSGSEGSDVGAIENCLGNEKLTSLGLTNAKTIGVLDDSFNEKIYWFITSDSIDALLEYDINTSQTDIIIQSTSSSGLLNFNKDFLINNSNKIINEDFNKNLLFWTDNLNPPRVINIERHRGSALDTLTEDDITVIKQPPSYAPTFTFTFSTESSIDSLESKFFAFAFRYKYIDGELSALSSFTPYAFSPNQLDIDLDTLENKGMKNTFNALNITLNTGGKNVTDIELVVKESNSNTVYIVETFNKVFKNLEDNTPFVYNFINDKTLKALSEKELYRTFDNVPILALTQDYVKNRMMYGNIVEGFDIKDSEGEEIDIKYELDITSSSLEGETLDSTTTNNNLTISVDLSNLILDKDVRINMFLSLVGVAPNIEANYSESFIFILEQDFNSVSDLVNSDAFSSFITDTMTSLFNTNQNSTPPLNVVSTIDFPFTFSLSGNTLNITSPYQVHTVDNTPENTEDDDTEDITYQWEFSTGISEFTYNLESTSSSLKTNRNLEVAIIYLAEYNRSSTALVSETNTIDIPQSLSIFQNKLKVTLKNKPPKDAVRYKFAIKQNKGFYYNIFVSQYYVDGQFVWAKLEGSNQDKISVGDVLYVKRDSTGVLENTVKATVLDIATKSKNFIEGNYYNETTGAIGDEDVEGFSELIEPQGVYVKFKTNGFNMNYDATSYFETRYYDSDDNSFPLTRVSGITSSGTLFPIEKNSIVEIYVRSKIERTDFDRSYSKRWVASADYSSFRDFYAAQVGFSGVLASPEVALTYFSNPYFTVEDTGDAVVFNSIYAGYGKRRTASIEVILKIRNSNGLVVFETIPDNNISEAYYETSETFDIIDGFHIGKEQNQTNDQDAEITLDFFNCYAMGEGIESITYLDAFNKPYLNIDLRPTAESISTERFKRVRKFADIIYSAVYNETTNLNGLNEFNLALVNYKDDLDKKYGSIQKIHSRNTDLLVIQEDKISTVLYGKNMIYNGDGSSSISLIENILGQQIITPGSGEYGTSRSPESFAYNGTRIYSVDPKRGTPIRLSVDGITEISMFGMVDFWKDTFRGNTYSVYEAEYDPYFDEYLVVVNNGTNQYTIGFSEKNKGWTSRYSFVPEKMIGMNNHLYSFKNGELYIHNSENVPRNNFYGVQYKSIVKTIFNEGPSDDKIFKTIVYEGNKPWKATLETNYTQGVINTNEFNPRESRWFAHTRKDETPNSLKGNAGQGIGNIISFEDETIVFKNISNIINIGDDLYNINGSDQVLIGKITDIDRSIQGNNTITINTIQSTPIVGEFAFSKKVSRIEGGEIRGYYLSLTLENEDTDFVELFSVNTNAVKSFI